jgi:hypothetical protein
LDLCTLISEFSPGYKSEAWSGHKSKRSGKKSRSGLWGKNEAGEAGRREWALEEEQEGLKMMQEKRAEEKKRWRRAGGAKSEAREAEEEHES